MICKEESDNPVYIKAYTISKCVNSCGRNFFDCSCNSSCVRNGTCCSDFRFCQVIQENHITKTKIPNCLFADEDDSICLQCKENFYYFNNQCLLKCSEITINLRGLNTNYMSVKDEELETTRINYKHPNVIIPYRENKICKEINLECNLDNNSIENYNCERCENKKCLKCKNGFYLFDNKCLKSCPVGMRANRINFTCEAKSSFSFYWIFPSFFSCKAKCGLNSLESDCSCRHSCLRRGNCCDDFEKECKQEIAKEVCKLCDNCVSGVCLKCKENSFFNSMRKNECNCLSGFYYDIQEDICLPIKLDKDFIIDEDRQNQTKNVLIFTNNPKHEENKIKPKITYKPVIYQNKTSPTLNHDKYLYFNQNSTNRTQKEFVYAEEVKKEISRNETNKQIKHNIDEKLLKNFFENYEKKSKNNANPNEKNNNNNKNSSIYNNHTKHYYNQNFEKQAITEKNILNPILNINLDNNKNDGIIDIVSNINEFTTHKTEKGLKALKDDLQLLNVFKNNTAIADLKNNKTEKSIINYNNHDINDIINKSLSEELLNSFKNLFSGFATDKAKSKQTLNLYLNGNISINLLTGNTNPQIIYKNIYNKDSYNTNKTISYNVISEKNQNETIKDLKTSELKAERSIEEIRTSNNIDSGMYTELSGRGEDDFSKLKIGTTKKPYKKESDDNNSDKKDANQAKNENANKIVSSIDKLGFDKTLSSNFLGEKNLKGLEITEDKIQKLLEDEELKSYLKRKIESVNKMKKKDINLINVDQSKKYEDGVSLEFLNPKGSKTREKDRIEGHLRFKRKNTSAF